MDACDVVFMGKIEKTNKEKIFLDSIGQKATVHREEFSGDVTLRHTQALMELGEFARNIDPALQHYEYAGSAVVHVFLSRTIESVNYVSSAQPLVIMNCPEPVASKAFDDLLRKMKETYGKRSSRLRSGF